MSAHTTVSIIIPCRNEKSFIGKCLDSIIVNDYPKDRLEVLVVDGLSDDGTQEIVQDYAKGRPFVTLLNNPKKITPAALNIGLANARGQVIMRMDAHAIYPPHYISELVSWLATSHADNVGGVCITLPGSDTAMAKAIAVALSHPFGVGNAYFRIGTSAPRWVDTVPFGCYRREVFARIGLFDEELVRNQDDEFNLRLIKRGGRILLVPEIVSYYYARESLRKLWRMYFHYGYMKPLVVRKVGSILTIRQVIPATFVLSLLAAGVLAPWSIYAKGFLSTLVFTYGALDLGCSIFASRRRGLNYMFPLVVAFPVLHLSYGLGFLCGTFDYFIAWRRRGKHAAEIPITR